MEEDKMYNYGSEAYELEYTSNSEKEKKRAESAAQERKRRAALLKKRRVRRTAMLRSLAVITVLAGVIMFRTAQIDKLCGETANLAATVEDLQAEVTEKEMAISSALDQNALEEIASSKLGMKKPDQSQYVYIQSQGADKGEVLSGTGKGVSGFAAFRDKLKRLLEYLY